MSELKITYVSDPTVKVYLGSKLVGHIRQQQDAEGGYGGWVYYPRGNKVGGDAFLTLAACKRSIEGN